MSNLEELRYPIGPYKAPATITANQVRSWINDLADFPQQLITLVADWTHVQLNAHYRDGGWTGRQVIHHLADSHINAYIRFHLTLTEEKPVIRPYFEDRWAELADGKAEAIELSINILEAIHARLVALLDTLTIDQFERTYIHPETNKEYTMFYLLGNYAWHGKHHLAHLQRINENR